MLAGLSSSFLSILLSGSLLSGFGVSGYKTYGEKGLRLYVDDGLGESLYGKQGTLLYSK